MTQKRIQKRYPAKMYGGKVIPGGTYWVTRESNAFNRLRKKWRLCFGR